MPVNYQFITPQMIYAGLRPTDAVSVQKLSNYVVENKPSGADYIDIFARLILKYGKRPAPEYAEMMNADRRHFDGAIRCLTGISAHEWVIEYLRLIACDLLEHTSLTFKEIGRMLNMSQSSFSQFFQAYQKMQPWEYRSYKQRGRKKSYFVG